MGSGDVNQCGEYEPGSFDTREMIDASTPIYQKNVVCESIESSRCGQYRFPI